MPGIPNNVNTAELRARAMEIASSSSKEDAQGMRDFHNLTLSMGLPMARAMFQMMVQHSSLSHTKKAAATKAIIKFSPITEVGCMKVDFYNQTTKSIDVAYLILDVCPKDHDIEAQLDKLHVHVSTEKWPEVLHHISMLFYIGRSTYAQLSRIHLNLIQDIQGLGSDDPCTKFLDLQVDMDNTTLYYDIELPKRVGIFVKLTDDLDS